MKKILISFAALAVSAAAIIAVNANNRMDEQFEANVGALARGESGGFGPMCSQTGNSGTYYMKLCNNCNGSFGHYALDQVAYCWI